MIQGEGAKHDKGKVRMGLCLTQFSNALLGVAKVLTFGALKYPDPATGDRSWQEVPDGVQRYSDAFDRHMYHVRKDIDDHSPGLNMAIDEETGQLHIDHAITNLLFIRSLIYSNNVDLPIIEPDTGIEADEQNSTYYRIGGE